MIHLELLLLIALTIAIIVIFFLGSIIISKNAEITKIKKRFKVKTDYEKLVYIADLYRTTNFENLRPDQIKMWIDWVNKNLK